MANLQIPAGIVVIDQRVRAPGRKGQLFGGCDFAKTVDEAINAVGNRRVKTCVTDAISAP
jgi:hypothetical protein